MESYSYSKNVSQGGYEKKCASHKSNVLPNNMVKQYCEWKGLLRMFISKIPFIN